MFNLLPRDGWLLFATRMVRLFAYGFLSVILVIYLFQVGLTHTQIGILLTLTFVGDAVISLWITTVADSLGRKKMLMLGSALMVGAGVLFALTDNFVLLVIAATIGVISPSGYEIGPFLAIEQSTLAQVVSNERRTNVFAWYYLLGSLMTAFGALASGFLIHHLQQIGIGELASYRLVVMVYAIMGLVLLVIFTRLSSAVEVNKNILNNNKTTSSKRLSTGGLLGKYFGIHSSGKIVAKLSLLFGFDAFAGSFVMNSIIAYWFLIRFQVPLIVLGEIFFVASMLSGFSGLVAARMAARFGLINTMIFTHVPSNILLILVPLMPNLPLAVGVFLLRCSISQMDVPTRQSYTMAVVQPDERSAAGGITNIARTLGAAFSPLFTSVLLGSVALLNISFFIAGGLKIIYDIMLYINFKRIKPPEEVKL